MSLPRSRCDVVIVGGGIIGCATGYHLARRGLRVRVLERSRIANEQSSRAWGFVRQQGRHIAEAELAAESARLWGGLAAELGESVGFVRSGILVTAETEEDESRLLGGAQESATRGVKAKVLSAGEIADRIPQLSGMWRAGLLTEDDGHVEPLQATVAYATAAKRRGAIISEGATVIGIDPSSGSTRVFTRDEEIDCHQVVCAAGIGTAALVRQLGVSLPIQAVRATVAQTGATNLAVPMPVWTPRVAFRPRPDGSFTVGNGYRGIDAEVDLTIDSWRHLDLFIPTFVANRKIIRLRFGKPFFDGLMRSLRSEGVFRPLPEPRPTTGLVSRNIKELLRVFPALGTVTLGRSWAGRIDATPDLIPIVGPIPGAPQVFAASGFNGHGLGLAPVVGQQLARWVADGRPSLSLHALRPERFSEGDIQRLKGAL